MFASFSLQLVRAAYNSFEGNMKIKHILHFDQARSRTTRTLRRSLAVGASVCALAISVLAQVDPGPPTPLVPSQSSQQDVPGWMANTNSTVGFWSYTVVAELPAVPEPTLSALLAAPLAVVSAWRRRALRSISQD